MKWLDGSKGLEDLGNYREGFCFRLISRTNVIWNVCADTMVHSNFEMGSIGLNRSKRGNG